VFHAGGGLLVCPHDHGNLDCTSDELKSKLKQVFKLGTILACSEKRGEEDMSLLLEGGKFH